MSCHDFICLTVTWLTEHDKTDIFPLHTYHSACRPVRDGSGCHSGGLAVFGSHHVSKHVHCVRTADDASYLWLKLTDIVLGYPGVYFCVCYMPQKKNFINLRNSHLLPSAVMNAGRMLCWSTKAEVPRFWSVVTLMLGRQRSQTF